MLFRIDFAQREIIIEMTDFRLIAQFPSEPYTLFDVCHEDFEQLSDAGIVVKR